MRHTGISVLLPIFNAEETLPACLQSIFDQSHEHFEIVAVDDGSVDSCVEILETAARTDDRLTLYKCNSHKGIVSALNLGISKCRYKWIARMDADDLMNPFRLESQLRFARENPELDIIGSQVRLFRDQAESLGTGQLIYQNWSNSLISHDQMTANLFIESPIMHPTFFLRRRTYDGLSGYRDTAWAEDYDFLMRAFFQGAVFGKVPEILIDKRDSLNRLYRTDPRGKPGAMLKAKAWYFARELWPRQKPDLVIIGTGSTGRMIHKELTSLGVDIKGFMDNKSSPPGRTIQNLPVLCWGNTAHFQTFNPAENCFFLLCIGNRKGRASLLEQFRDLGFQSWQNYLQLV